MKVFLRIAGVLVLGAGLAAAILGHLAVMWVALVAIVTCLIAANLDRIADFKASSSGVEAKTRDVIARAETAVSELQLLAAIVGEVTLSLVKRSGRLGGYCDSEGDAIREGVVDVLRRLGVSKTELPHVMDEWHRFTTLDYAHAILGGNTVPDGVDQTIIDEWKSLRTGGLAKIPAPEEIREFLSKHGVMTAERAGDLEDYEFYRTRKRTVGRRCGERDKSELACKRPNAPYSRTLVEAQQSVGQSVDRIKRRLTEPPFSALPPSRATGPPQWLVARAPARLYSSQDSMSLAIAHLEAKELVVLDALRERRPPFGLHSESRPPPPWRVAAGGDHSLELLRHPGDNIESAGEHDVRRDRRQLDPCRARHGICGDLRFAGLERPGGVMNLTAVERALTVHRIQAIPLSEPVFQAAWT
jgi:hypothetical protein